MRKKTEKCSRWWGNLPIVLATLSFAMLGGCEYPSEVRTELPTTPTENMSHLLVKPESAANDIDLAAPRDLLPDPNVDWVVTFDFSDQVSGEEINNLLDITWLKNNGNPTIYGFSPAERHWTLVSAKDSPDKFTRLKIAWPLWDAINEKPRETMASDLQKFYFDSELKLANLGSSEGKVERKVEDSLAVVSALPALLAECDQDVTLRLVASQGTKFPGAEVWDVMLCLGLDYGDGDLFHWINNSGFGEDHFFTVETSTPPGYFIPERIVTGEGDVDDLIFSFSIPRSADPVSVFDSMAGAVKYAQDRLGGQILMGTQQPFEMEAERNRLQKVVETLGEAGFVPGEPATCRVF